MLMAGYYPFRPASWLSIEGEDAPEFLQGQFTNHLPPKSARSCTYGLWLDRKGRVQADGSVLRTRDEGFQLFSYGSPARVLVDHLEAFIIADDVEVIDETQGVAGISVVGDSAVSALEKRLGLPAPGEVLATEEGTIFVGRRSGGPNFEWVMAADARPAAMAGLRDAGLEEMGRVQIDRIRLQAGIPLVPEEIGPGDFPQEGGLERDAISFTKGCYLGQEVMARLQATGRVRRRLVPVRVDGEVTPPAPLYKGAVQVGELRTRLATDEEGANGFAMIKLGSGVVSGDGLAFEPDGPVRVQHLGRPAGEGR